MGMLRFGFLAFALLTACGGSAPASKTEEAAATNDRATAPDSHAESHPPGKTLAQHREDFMTRCGSSLPAPDYCQCTWEVMAKNYTVDEMNSPTVEPTKMQAYKEQATATCAGKLPEAGVKAKFQTGCVGEHPRLGAYCGCAWTELRKSLSVGDLALDETVNTPRFETAKKSMMKVCGGQMPEDVPRDDFYKGCGKDDPKLQPFCACAWKAMRTTMSPAQIAGASREDMEPLKGRIAKSCGPLLPK